MRSRSIRTAALWLAAALLLFLWGCGEDNDRAGRPADRVQPLEGETPVDLELDQVEAINK